jgi:cell division protein FtsW (lipid II flippase)/cell division protein FtsI/penicillin-binding protein 2
MSVREKDNQSAIKREGLLLLSGSALILLLFFYRLYISMLPGLTETEKNLYNGHAVLLDAGVKKENIAQVISNGNYLKDPADIALLADSLYLKLITGNVPANLGALNKQAFFITVPRQWNSKTGGVEFQSRLFASRQRLGFDSLLYVKELNDPDPLSAANKISNGNLSISGKVSLNGNYASGVLVQLKEHITGFDQDTSAEKLFYVRTDNEGRFSFTGLLKDSSYSVLPLKPGFEFGSRKGTAWLTKNAGYSFAGREHKMRLIGSTVYNQMREDGIFIVRNPESFKTIYWLIALSLIAAFFIVQLILVFRKNQIDPFLLPLLLLLCGISMLLLFSIQDPLSDTLYASQALQGVVAGLAGFTILSRLNFSRIYGKWWFDGLFNYRQKKHYGLNGWTWLVMAIVLSIITLIFGTGPEGSGVKVNLVLGGLSFQPGEITKYLLLIFLAAFFAANHENLRNFSDIRWRFKISLGVLAGIAIILMLYLLMGDMGPALVVCFTFLFFYSIARGNLLFTILSGLVYGISLLFLPGLVATAISVFFVLLVSFFSGHLKTMKWYGVFAIIADAPVIILLVIGAFTFGDEVPGIGSRLSDRKAIWLDQWENDVYGGDHLAHSYWTLSSGGISGTGIGKGFPNTMPAAHTDMILPSIGEELGWTGIAGVLILFAILIHRCFLFARRSGNPFAFYLCAGIAIATGVQLLLIAGGSIGLLPLTGITVPFLSYGKISLIINLAAMGIIAGISALPGKTIQQEYIRKNYDPVLITGISFFLLGIIALLAQLINIQVVNRKNFIVKPARVIMKSGTPVYSYNPRIEKLMKLLAAGDIYDRNGLVIATSKKETIAVMADSLNKAGINKQDLQNVMTKRVNRYYPFDNELFYWTGDYNTKLFWGQSNGYFAEARHLTALRGFGVSRSRLDSIHSMYKPDRFTKPYRQAGQLVLYDFTALKDGLTQAIDSNNNFVQQVTQSDRNLKLTVDAALQVEIQDSLQQSLFNRKRIAVVVLDAGSGDLLASAMHPLPALHTPELMDLPQREKDALEIPITDRDPGMTYATAPGSTVKILTALAGLNKLGSDAAKVKYNDIYRTEIFRDNPTEQEPFVPKVKYVDMHEAIVHSSNIFFIRLANDYDLEDHMAALYKATGMSLHQVGGYNYAANTQPQSENASLAVWKNGALKKDRRNYSNPEYKGKTKRYRSDFSGLAWGQSVLTSTPAAMARMAGGIANNGVMQPSRYILQEAGSIKDTAAGITIANDTAYAGLIMRYMIDQSNTGKQKIKNLKVAGKTGTPERIVRGIKQSDGWYVFFAPVPGKTSCTVVCVRIENGLGSGNAVIVANKVAEILERRNYMKSFE